MAIIRALPGCESGRVFLKLTSDFEKAVRVKGVFIDPPGEGGASRPLLEKEIELVPNQAQNLDVTEKFLSLFRRDSPGRQEKQIRIRLHLEPEPPSQPGRGAYRVVFEKGRFVEFVSK